MNKRFRRPYGKGKIKKDVVLDKNETNSSLCYPHKLYRKHDFCLSPAHNRCSASQSRNQNGRFSNILVDNLKNKSNWNEMSKWLNTTPDFLPLSVLPKPTILFKQRVDLGMLIDGLLRIMCARSTTVFLIWFFLHLPIINIKGIFFFFFDR